MSEVWRVGLLACAGCRIWFEPYGDGECSADQLYETAPRGTGTTDDPYIVCSTEQLRLVVDAANSATAEIVLGRDLDLEDVPFPGFGSVAAPYHGTFDGKGHVLRNLRIASAGAAGFINASYGARIERLRLEQVNVEGTNEVGTIIGRASISQVIDVDVIDANVRGDNSVGGITGSSAYGLVRDATFTGRVSGSTAVVGGISGAVSADVFMNIEATVDVDAPLASDVGGVLGVESLSHTLVQNVFVQGTVVGDVEVGGFLGANTDGVSFYRSRFEGTVRGNSRVGGIVGGNYDTPFNVRSSSVRADVTGTQMVGGFSGRYDYKATFEDSYFTGTITGVGAQQESIGGFFGFVGDSGTAGTNAYVDAVIDTDGQMVGGFIGSRDANVEISSSFAVASVTGSSPTSSVSWWIGDDTAGTTFMGTDSYYWSGATCTNRGGGGCTPGPNTVADVTQLQDPNAAPLTQWDFANVWRGETAAFPTLRLEQPSAPTVNVVCATNIAIVGYRYSCPVTITDADVNELRAPMFTRAHTCEWLAARLSSLSGVPLMSAVGDCSSELYASDGQNDTAPQTVSIEVHAGFSVTPTLFDDVLTISFSLVAVGMTSVYVATLTNREPVSTSLAVTIPPGPYGFAGGAFPGVGGTCTSTVAPGASCTLALAFTPTTTGQAQAPMTILFTAGRGPVSYVVDLIGSGL
jgi:hypothetical protein